MGERDEGHDGYTPGKFLALVNEHIWEVAKGLYGDKLIPEKVPQLTLSEVLAIRLYTGPGYTPINSFLREVAKLGSGWRAKIAHMHQLSYSATVWHLTNGLRKLVRVYGNGQIQTKVGKNITLDYEKIDEKSKNSNSDTGSAAPNKQFATVFRGVRGELPDAFWLKDDFDMVTATDFAFMSTSVDGGICQQYMDSSQVNVLWEIRCKAETSEGFHSGADVSLLSQFPSEKEMLFPPLTMLTVCMEDTEERNDVDIDADGFVGDEYILGGLGGVASQAKLGRNQKKTSIVPVLKRETTKAGAAFVRIVVTPTFI